MWKLIAFAAAGLALLPLAAQAHGGTEVIVEGHLHPDGPITIEGEEFAPNDRVVIELRRAGMEPVVLGEVGADDEGAFEASLHVPARVRPGFYQLVAAGEESASLELPIEAVPGGAGDADSATLDGNITNDRPAAETVGLATVTAVLALLAVVVLWSSRATPSAAEGETPPQPN